MVRYLGDHHHHPDLGLLTGLVEAGFGLHEVHFGLHLVHLGLHLAHPGLPVSVSFPGSDEDRPDDHHLLPDGFGPAQPLG